MAADCSQMERNGKPVSIHLCMLETEPAAVSSVFEINLENPLHWPESNTGLPGAPRTLHKGSFQRVPVR